MKHHGPIIHPERFDFNKSSKIILFYDGFKTPREIDPDYLSVFCIAEPLAIKKYKRSFLRQFDCVITHRKLALDTPQIINRTILQTFCGIEFDPVLARWKVEFKTNKQLIDRYVKFEDRKDAICCITSSKTFSKGQKDRLNLINTCKSLGIPIDVYGMGFRPVADKHEVLSKYKYCLAIENSVEENYFSEKAIDGMISGCNILYLGAPNLSEVVPSRLKRIIREIRPTSASLLKTYTEWKNDVPISDRDRLSISEASYNEFDVARQVEQLIEINAIKKTRMNPIIYPETSFTFSLRA